MSPVKKPKRFVLNDETPCYTISRFHLSKNSRGFLESREYKGRSDKARELYDLAWKYLKPLWYYKIAALYAQDFQNILDKMADDGLSQSMLEKSALLSVSCIALPLAGVSWMLTLHLF